MISSGVSISESKIFKKTEVHRILEELDQKNILRKAALDIVNDFFPEHKIDLRGKKRIAKLIDPKKSDLVDAMETKLVLSMLHDALDNLRDPEQIKKFLRTEIGPLIEDIHPDFYEGLD